MMSSISTYMAMDGYGGFIWPAYGLAFLIMGGLLTAAVRKLRRNRDELRRLREESEIPAPPSP